MELTGTAGELIARWGWIVALVVVFALVYKFGTGGSSGSSSPAGVGCLAAVAITLLFFVFVIF
ncbi:hypothetical protein [Phycicoccus sp. SLBN-51]|uniref:hypothetical protein n=1 Tax=Phycicoccus sp. SLBN-51 TaxID=2768447 RepID=UPI0011524774|nr:hypothetical protein [Phycicoccus sp. SLBN-51]TQJ51709.1 hypothetical protein FBY26_3447 [Phycicoccus sp. SLBN-51]